MLLDNAMCPSVTSVMSGGIWSPAAKATRSHRHLGKRTQKAGNEFRVSFIASLGLLDAAKHSEIQLYKQWV